MYIRVKALLLGLSSSFLFGFDNRSMAQQPGTPTAKTGGVPPSVRSKVIDLTQVEPVIGLPPATVMGYPSYCSSDGTIFMQVYADGAGTAVSNFPTIYSISESRQVGKIAVAAPQSYKQAMVRSLFATAQKIAIFIQASQPTDPSERLPPGHLASFIAVSERDGSAQKTVKLGVSFLPVKVAMFDSGDFLVLGVDAANQSPVLALVDSGGSLKRMLDLDARNYASSKELAGTYNTKVPESNTNSQRALIVGALNQAQFVPWGSQILLVEPGSRLPVLRIHDSGQEEATAIKPPTGFLLGAILGSDTKDSWIMVAKESTSFGKLSHGEVIENAPESLLEIDPYTGGVLARLAVTGPQVAEVACAAHGKLSAMYYGIPEQPNVPNQLTYASAPR